MAPALQRAGLYELLQNSTRSLARGALPPPTVVKSLVSRVLGYGVIAGACVVKLPQVVAIQRAQSAKGLSVLSVEMEELALLVHSAYGLVLGLPFSAFGEALVLLAQNTLLLFQVYHFTAAGLARPAAAAALLAAGVGGVWSGAVDRTAVSYAFDFNNALLVAARLPQILKNYRASSTGQLSLVVCCANLLGNIARVFTSIQEGVGMAMLRGCILGGILNAILVLQVLYYRQRQQRPKRE